MSSAYRDAGVMLIDNSPEEIRELATELLDAAFGRLAYTAEEDALQERFRRLLQPGHYSYGAASRIGRHFLHARRSLLDPPD